VVAMAQGWEFLRVFEVAKRRRAAALQRQHRQDRVCHELLGIGVEGVGLRGDGMRFGAGDVEIYDDGFLAAADDYGFDGFVFFGVEFLMGDVGRDVDEVAGAGFVDEFEVIAPAETGATADDVDYGFEFAVMVGAGFGVGMDDDGAGPEFLRADAGVRDGFGAGHAGGLRGVGVEVVGADNAQAVLFPVARISCRDVGGHRCLVLSSPVR
jgi:hypothetical protein